MLTESFIAATSAPPKLTQANSSAVKDAGIFLHSFQPSSGLQVAFKKSLTLSNCLAWNDSHIFAAQSGKSSIHVYSRAKGNQEATIPFPERIRSIVLIAEGTALVLGTENGALSLWEIATGRQLTVASAHLRAVTCLAADDGNGYLLSGSEDSTIHVWSYLDLLSFHHAFESHEMQRTPRRTLSAHNKAITSLAVGRTGGILNISMSASEDGSLNVWNHQNAQQLRTYLLDSIPRSIALDPADRAIFVGLEDGGVQFIEFYPSQSDQISSELHSSEKLLISLNNTSTGRWRAPNSESGATLCLSVSFDGATIISGHTSGLIVPWNVANGQPGPPVVTYEEAPVTTVSFLKPGGLPLRGTASHFKAAAPVRPKPHEEFSSSNGKLTGNYNLYGQITNSSELLEQTELQSLFDEEGVPASLRETLESGLWLNELNTASNSDADEAADFLALDGGSEAEIKLKNYQDQIEHLKRLQKASNKRHEEQQRQIRDLQLKIGSR